MESKPRREQVTSANLSSIARRSELVFSMRVCLGLLVGVVSQSAGRTPGQTGQSPEVRPVGAIRVALVAP